MKMYKSCFLCIGALSNLTVVFCEPEKVIMPLLESKNQLEYYTQQYPYTVVYCYALTKPHKAHELEIKRIYSLLQKNMMQHASEYSQIHVKFVAVNRAVGDLISLQDEYNFTNDAAYLIFFKYGVPIAMKKIPQQTKAHVLNEFIAARLVEKKPSNNAVLAKKLATRSMPSGYDNQEKNCPVPCETKECFASETDAEYCDNRLCKKCRYKRPISYYDQKSDFLIGDFDHLYGDTYSYTYGNYWGGTIMNPIN